jgi:Domain of unknown function (DUF4267)
MQTVMTPDRVDSSLKTNSLLFWCTLLVPAAIIPLGIDFLLNPIGAPTGFGIPIHDHVAFPCLWTNGIGDIFSGLVMLPFVFRRNRRAIATIYTILILVPVGDGLIILQHLGFAPPIYIHWGTALYMLIVATSLLRIPLLPSS